MTTLLFIHALGMLGSLLATIYMVAAAATSQNVRSWFIRLNLIITSVGLASGVLLLINHPLDMRCAVLVSYLLAFAGAYYYVRQKASTHTSVSAKN